MRYRHGQSQDGGGDRVCKVREAVRKKERKVRFDKEESSSDRSRCAATQKRKEKNTTRIKRDTHMHFGDLNGPS